MASINHIETVVPDYRFSQNEVAEFMMSLNLPRHSQQYLNGIYSESGISYRHSVLPDFGTNSEVRVLNESTQETTTKQRNEIFIAESKKLLTKLTSQLKENCKFLDAKNITHLITVSCTGFYNPGPDFQLIQELGISSNVERYHIGFMGCYAAFPALKMAKQFCDANPKANVLIVSLELCTLHFRKNEELDSLIANSVFADGAAAVLVSADKQPKSISLNSFTSNLLNEAEKDMAWTIGDHGFEMTLSRYVPKIIGANIKEIIGKNLQAIDLAEDEIDLWAIHPGGKSILDKIEQGLSLSSEKTASSRKILNDYGNMSSVSIFFVLKDILDNKVSSNKILAMAFGPGLVIESGFMSLN